MTDKPIKKIIIKILGEPFFNRLYGNYMRFRGHAENSHSLKNRERFYAGFIKPGDLVFDIGANYGNRTLPFLNLKARVIAVEPQIKCVEFLHARFGTRIEVVNKGIGSKAESKFLYESDQHYLSTFSEEWVNKTGGTRFQNAKWQKSAPVEIITLDRLIADFGEPAFIKIDVEGYEVEVLKGLTFSVQALSFEYAVPEFTENIEQCIHLLERINNRYVFNFSAGESMQFSSEKWLEAKEMLEFIQSPPFIASSFGDIYALIPQ